MDQISEIELNEIGQMNEIDASCHSAYEEPEEKRKNESTVVCENG
jgi:hypothetical protein